VGQATLARRRARGWYSSRNYDRNAISLEEYTRTFAYQAGQCGVAFAVAGDSIGLDLFDHLDTMRHYFSKLIRSYALDALDADAADATKSGESEVSEFLKRVASAQSFAEPAVGLGKDVRCGSLLPVLRVRRCGSSTARLRIRDS